MSRPLLTTYKPNKILQRNVQVHTQDNYILLDATLKQIPHQSQPQVNKKGPEKFLFMVRVKVKLE